MSAKITVGLVPLYIELYDRTSPPSRRVAIEAFYEKAAVELEARGLNVLRAPVCRLKNEFADAIDSFEAQGAQCLVTLHLAYSPSLESADVLAATKLPIVVMDTTPTFDFSPYQAPTEIGTNHGIHGVMDMCNLLRRRGKQYAIASGHITESPVAERVAGLVRAGVAAQALNGMKVASIGGSFHGMGDFLVTDDEMKNRFGVKVVYPSADTLSAAREAVTEEEVQAEMELDLAAGVRLSTPNGNFTPEVHARTARDCLALRHWINEENIGAYSTNFLTINGCGLKTMPFMEAGKSMARGLGYAGEGDVLTAAFVGALRQGFEDTSFIEIFCPDWKGNRVMLSHMGEMNFGCVDGKLELGEVKFVYGAENPIVAYGRYRAGKAIFANIYRDENGFRLLLSPVTMDQVPADDAFAGKVRGWLKPAMPVTAFLEGISRFGATHHSVLVYDASLEALEFFGRLLGLPVEVL